jgi:hypothetical protein
MQPDYLSKVCNSQSKEQNVTALNSRHYLPYILESNPHLVFATFLNEKKKLVRASNPHLSFNRPLPTGRLFE